MCQYAISPRLPLCLSLSVLLCLPREVENEKERAQCSERVRHIKADGGWRDENEHEVEREAEKMRAAGNRNIKSVISDSSNNI